MLTINPNTRIIDLTVGELLDLISTANKPKVVDNTKNERRLVYGIKGIASIFGCSISTANRIKSSGKIDRAMSQIGRKITIDADLALELMNKEKTNN